MLKFFDGSQKAKITETFKIKSDQNLKVNFETASKESLSFFAGMEQGSRRRTFEILFDHIQFWESCWSSNKSARSFQQQRTRRKTRFCRNNRK